MQSNDVWNDDKYAPSRKDSNSFCKIKSNVTQLHQMHQVAEGDQWLPNGRL